MVNDQTASHSYHGRMEDVSHGTSRWRIRRQNSTFLWHFRRRVQQQKRRRTGWQPSMPHWHRHIRSWRLQLKPWEPPTATPLRYWIRGRPKKAHHSSHWWQPREAFLYQQLSVRSLFLAHSHKPRGRVLAVPLPAGYCFKPWDLYYQGNNTIII